MVMASVPEYLQQCTSARKVTLHVILNKDFNFVLGKFNKATATSALRSIIIISAIIKLFTLLQIMFSDIV